jgi:hypothetical protein
LKLILLRLELSSVKPNFEDEIESNYGLSTGLEENELQCSSSCSLISGKINID